ncbi:TetR/AcrR family transcriptional regulator [Flaviflagellibacter deserti]|uniref:TetR/AcrR family transcriptional regulator n=1 Tax=Flaviflagellibacter deserti TaxID=2267266 RepID=A0ABV9YW69_9HYPH
MKMGRPRGFDIGEALDRAQTVFCSRGYDAASLSELTKAMGINSPSLYSAFGSKEGLFRAVLDRYGQQRVQYLEEALSAPTARETVERIFATAALLYSEDGDQASWLVMRGGVALGCEAIAQDLADRRERIEIALRDRFQRAADEGDLPGTTSPAGLARYVMSVLTGMGVQAAAGADKAELDEIAKFAMNGLPAA